MNAVRALDHLAPAPRFAAEVAPVRRLHKPDDLQCLANALNTNPDVVAAGQCMVFKDAVTAKTAADGRRVGVRGRGQRFNPGDSIKGNVFMSLRLTRPFLEADEENDPASCHSCHFRKKDVKSAGVSQN